VNALCMAIQSCRYGYLYNGDHNASHSRLYLPSEILVSILFYLLPFPTRKSCRDFALLYGKEDPPELVFVVFPNTVSLSCSCLLILKFVFFLPHVFFF
jgi:hypothetical protein